MSYQFVHLPIYPNQMARAQAALRAEFGPRVGVDQNQGNRFAYLPSEWQHVSGSDVLSIVQAALTGIAKGAKVARITDAQWSRQIGPTAAQSAAAVSV
jgi:hypothetical protein